ncbi:BspA family leucine-rich repeat surface protein [Rapidithrix thailandica]|uniref:BspA family leucine-rich repeat surface protein n=1 Tax=Rapidithrix thailandica TaxID=413964 RepID=A0AAW9S3B7_9BACT
MKRLYWIIKLIALAGIVLSSCDVDDMNYSLEEKDVYVDSVVIEAANNSFLEADIVASVTNYSRSITASLPNSSADQDIVLTIYLQEGIRTIPSSGEAVSTGKSMLTVLGFGLEEEYTVDLKVLEPFQSDEEFVTVWTAEANEKITLPLIETGNYNFKVFWGDGESSIVAAYDLEAASHTYTEAGDYTVTIWGKVEGFNFHQTGASAANIIDITDWGQIKLGNDGGYFRACSNLQVSAANAPDLSETTNLKAMFREAASFNSNINHWDVSQVTNMQDMFYKASNYNQPLDQWDVSYVTTFETMFRESAFDQDITGWEVSRAQTLKNMFRDSPFNQAIGVWDVSNVTSFQSTFRGNDAFDQDLSGWGDKLGKVITMREMFRESDYNGDLSAWDVSKVLSMWDMFKNSGFNNASIANWDLSSLDNMETMFGGSACAFNQDISNWNVSKVVNMQNLFQHNQVFNQDLSGWDVSSVKCNYNFDDGASQWEDAHKPKFKVDNSDNNEFCNRDN